jgi:hypothetical protein
VIDVLTLDGEQITAINAFVTAEQLQAPVRFTAADFTRFGLPADLPS